MRKKLQHYLHKLLELEGSDLHLKAGSLVHMRLKGELHSVKSEKLTNDNMLAIADEILNKDQYNKLIENQELDCAYVLDNEKRFRVNFFYQMHGLSAVFRVIPEKVLSLEELQLPKVIGKLAELNHGLILVTGTSNSGKSTTLAALLDRINKTKRKHIISIEDPVEFLHTEYSCLISQRSVGTNTRSFSNALKAALREDMDIIFIGEVRDLETMEIALHAADTGHLVVATIHTLDAKETISRVVAMFPKEEQDRIRMTLSFVLESVISQRLVKTMDGDRVPAVEVLLKTKRISELIAENRDSEILESIEKGKEIYGTQSFDQSLFELYSKNIIGKSVALSMATNPSDMSLKIQGIQKVSGGGTKDVQRRDNKGVFDLK